LTVAAKNLVENQSIPGPINTWMGDCRQTGKPSWYVTIHPRQLNLAIPLWIAAVGTIDSWDVDTEHK